MDPAANNTASGPQGGDDMGDKAANFINSKTGKPQSRATLEKITDGLRGVYEKITGKKVSSKISN